ncbi:MAG: energy-coupling factor transporter transmembrane protein EcfT [Propionibacteriaceae bacterium]|nr:energy-coupling factor transporter transmembrane protein EcfT [Propionibacteriaceae bacterium]
MNQVFSIYVPGHSLMHRTPVWLKYVLMLGIMFSSIIVMQWWYSVLCLAVSMLLVLATGVGPRMGFKLSWGVYLMAGLLLAFQLFLGRPEIAVAVSVNIFAAIYASRMLTISTPESTLIDALVSGCRVLKPLGVNPETVGLAIGIMLKSIPMLMDTVGIMRQAAKARGMQSNYIMIMTPVVVRAVGYAQETGAALAARGLAE